VVLGVLGEEAFKEIGPFAVPGRVVVDGVGEIENIIANATEASSASTSRHLPQNTLQRLTVGQNPFSGLRAVEFLSHHCGSDLHHSG
jgi:hypothetical protein